MSKQGDEKKSKRDIKTRPPQKRTDSGIFANLRRLPHPVEEILGLQSQDQDPNQPKTEPAVSSANKRPSRADSAPDEPGRSLAKPAISLANEKPSRPLAKPIIDLESCYKIPTFISDELMPTLPPSEQIVLHRLCRLSFGINRDTTDPVSL